MQDRYSPQTHALVVLRPWFSACPARILRAIGSSFQRPKYLSWIFYFDSSFFTGISFLNTVRQ